MASFKNTMKYGLLRHPSIFPNPINVSVHLFCVIGNGYQWVDGELIDILEARDFTNLKMKYPEDQPVDPEMANLECLASLYTERRLKKQADILRRKFIEENIEEISSGSPTQIYFSGSYESYYFTQGICLDYARAFSFPEDIKEDWAKALYAFLEYWLVSLNIKYGVNRKDLHDISFWPEDIQHAHKKIDETRKRLYVHAHCGVTYEQYIEKSKAIMRSLDWDSIKSDN